MSNLHREIIEQVSEEARRAFDKHGPCASPHEAYGLICEEVEEYFEEVRKKHEVRSRDKMRGELVQVAALAVKAIESMYPERSKISPPESAAPFAVNFPAPTEQSVTNMLLEKILETVKEDQANDRRLFGEFQFRKETPPVVVNASRWAPDEEAELVRLSERVLPSIHVMRGLLSGLVDKSEDVKITLDIPNGFTRLTKLGDLFRLKAILDKVVASPGVPVHQRSMGVLQSEQQALVDAAEAALNWICRLDMADGAITEPLAAAIKNTKAARREYRPSREDGIALAGIGQELTRYERGADPTTQIWWNNNEKLLIKLHALLRRIGVGVEGGGA